MFPLRDTIPTHHFPLINWLLIVANVVFFMLQLTLDFEAVIYLFGIIPQRVVHPEMYEATTLGVYFPFLSNMFLHGGWGHLLGNIWTLYIFGDNVEDRMGKMSYLFFYVFCGILASVAHVVLNLDSTIPAVGASGAISGVMGAYMLMFPKSRILMLFPIIFIPFFFEISAFVYLAFWFLLQLFSGWQDLAAPSALGGVAFWAHIGGFLAGIILYRLFLDRRYHEKVESARVRKYPRREVRNWRRGNW